MEQQSWQPRSLCQQDREAAGQARVYLLHCLNSWGDANNPNPVIENKDIVSLHYVSLFMENYIVLSSIGPAAEHQGSKLGIYQEKGVYNGSKYYEQVHTLNTAKKGEFVFRDKDGPWKIGDTLGGSDVGIKNLNNTSTLPLLSVAGFHSGENNGCKSGAVSPLTLSSLLRTNCN